MTAAWLAIPLAESSEADRGQGFPGIHARPQHDAAQHHLQLHPLHQAQRGYEVRRVQQQVKNKG